MRHRFLLLCGLCALFFTKGHSQHFQVKNYTIDDGLPSANVLDIAQAADGRMWFATRAGVVSYDGFKWQQHKRVFDGYPHFITLTAQDTLWALSKNARNGLARYDGKNWKLFEMPADINSGPFSGLQVLEKSASEKSVFVALSKGGILKFDNEGWHFYNQDDGLPSDSVLCISVFKQKIYALTAKGLAAFDGKKFKKIPFKHPSKKTKDFAFDNSGNLILIGEGWFARRLGQSFKITEVPDIVNLYGTNKAYVDDKNRLYIPTAFNTVQYNLDSGELMTLNRNNGLIMDAPHRILQDREKNLWMVSTVGISKIFSRRFFNYTSKNGLLNDEVSAIVEYRPGHFILGHNTGYTFYDGADFKKRPFPKSNKVQNSGIYRIWDLAVQQDGTVWSASIFRGISKINLPNFTWYFNDISPTHVSVVVDSSDRPWALVNKNLYMFETNRFKKLFSIPENLSKGRKIFAGPDDDIYIATGESGIIKVDLSGEFSVIRCQQNSLKNNVYAVHFDSGKMLVGSSAGLFEVHADSFIYAQDFPKIDYPVYSITKDNAGNYWIGTDRGVLYCRENKVRHFTHLDGLAGNETNRSAAMVDSKGRLWLGTDYGLSIYNPAYDRDDIPAPLVDVATINAGGKTLLPESGEVSTQDNTILFEFRAVSLKNERAIKAQYMLEGLDIEWNTLDPLVIPEVRYNQLPPGEYRFKVRARSPESDWSPVRETALLHIDLPFYKQPWFALFLTGLAVSLVFVSYLAYQRKEQAGVLEEKVRTRTMQLRSSEQKFREFFERSNDLVFFCDGQGRITDINTAGLNVLGMESTKKAIGKKIDDFLGQDPSWLKSRNELMEKGSVSARRLHLFEGTEKERQLLFSASLQYDSKGDVEHWHGTIKDITDNQRMQEQEKYLTKMEAISQMAGGIAHDFNNLLGAILGYASLLKLKHKKGDDDYFALDTIEKSAERGARLTGQLLAFGRRKKSDKNDINVDSLIKEILNHFKSAKELGVEIVYEGNRELMVLADAEQLEQILEHVLQNAVDAIKDKGRVHISSGIKKIKRKKFTSNPASKSDSYGYISIRDDGCGMDEEIREKMFEPFFTTKKQSRGKGLGLAVVHGYLNGNKAFADVSSTPGKGTTFTIFLPLGSGVKEPAKPVLTKAKDGASVLVIEDENEMRTLISSALEMMDYSVQCAATGEDGLQMLEKKKDYDLVILDMLMPGMNGDETLAKMRQKGIQSRVLIVSGFSTETHLQRWNEMKVDGFLAKPFSVNDLRAQVAALLKQT